MCFVLIKGWSKYAKQNKTSNYNFGKRRAQQFVLFLIIGVIKNGRLSAEANFAHKKKKLFYYIGKNKGDLDYF